jgi:hypothetical protein
VRADVDRRGQRARTLIGVALAVLDARLVRARASKHPRARRALLRLSGAALVSAVLATGIAAQVGGNGTLRAERVGTKAGIYEVNHTYRANAGDINGDGHQDLIVIPHYANFPRVYINQGDGTFVDIHRTHFPEERTKPRDRHDCPIGDVTGDGRADIVCTTGGKKGGTGHAPSELWIQQDDGTFAFWRDTDFDFGTAKDAFGRSRDAVLLDANGDGHLDLYIQNAYPRADGRSGTSRLYINEDGERFVRAREHGFTGANVRVGGTNLQAVDFDGDGHTDIVACGKRGVYIFHNVRGQNFRETGARRGGRRSCLWVEVARVDGSGRPAMIRLNRRAVTVHEQKANGRFGPAAYRRSLRHGEAFATGDVTGNGRADIYVVRKGSTEGAGEPGPGDDRPDAMLINAGKGTDFRRMSIPQIKRGRGDAVTAIDYDGNGRSAFVIMNGHRKAKGPIDLIAFRGG